MLRLGRVRLLAALAQLAGQPLGDDAVEGAPNQERLDAHLDQPVGGASRIVGVQGGKHEVTGQGRFHCDRRRLAVPDLTHEDDVGVRPQDACAALQQMSAPLWC